jgi:hypothetical protein
LREIDVATSQRPVKFSPTGELNVRLRPARDAKCPNRQPRNSGAAAARGKKSGALDPGDRHK